MKLVIVGAGKIGATLVEKLSKEEHDIVIVDKDAKIVEQVVNRYDVMGVCGGGADRMILEEAGVADADFVIACTSRDELNILCCMLAKKIGAAHTIARVRDPEYFMEMEYMKGELDIDMWFNPERRTAQEIAEILSFPSAINVETFADGAAVMIETKVKKDNPMIGKTVMDLNRDLKVSILFSAVIRENKVYIPRGDFVIQEGDVIHITASEKGITDFSKKTQTFRRRARSVFIIGGGKIAYYLAKELIERKVSVKIIEKDEARCEWLSEELPEATILHGDGTDHEVLDEEGIDRCNAVVTLTGMDEENVIVSLYATRKKVAKVITKVDRPTIGQMVSHLGLDSVLSPRTVIASSVVRFVREIANEGKARINQLYKIHDKVEALEFPVTSSFGYKGVPLKELNVKKNFLVNGIVRDGEFIIPTGDTAFMEGDKVLVVTTEKNVSELEDIIR
ncbi:MAG: Trk system potassium transporter TrkA [Clostridia bacterium]|nr:Trk system potassium transporter TrkA [Clostridia bacterium]MBO7178337.1 Trk system potassium transporter TrkA [Clostridia bacterium]